VSLFHFDFSSRKQINLILDQKFEICIDIVVLKKSHFWKKANNDPKIVFAKFDVL